MKKLLIAVLLCGCTHTDYVTSDELTHYTETHFEDHKAEQFLLSVMQMWDEDKDVYVTRVDITETKHDSDGTLSWFFDMTYFEKNSYVLEKGEDGVFTMKAAPHKIKKVSVPVDRTFSGRNFVISWY